MREGSTESILTLPLALRRPSSLSGRGRYGHRHIGGLHPFRTPGRGAGGAFARICGGGKRRARGYPEGLACSGILPSRGGAVPPPSAGIARPGRGRLAHLPAFAVTGFTGRWGMLERPPVVLRFFSGGGTSAERRSMVAAQQRRRTPIMQIIISENFDKFR